MDDKSRMKGFGGEQAKRMILQAMGKDSERRPKYKDLKPNQMGAKTENVKQAPAKQWREPWREKNIVGTPAPMRGSAAASASAPPVKMEEMEFEEDEDEFAP